MRDLLHLLKNKFVKTRLTQEFIMNWWLKKYHNISVKWLLENEPEFVKTPHWYTKYAVTQEQHDEWYNWAINYMSKYYKMPKQYIKRNFGFDYLNCSPAVLKTNN